MSLLNTTFKDIFISHIKPYKYKGKNNTILGKYAVSYDHIEFKPVYNACITDTVRALIDISNEHKIKTHTCFNGVHVYVPYPTNSDDATIQNIIDSYNRTYKYKMSVLQAQNNAMYVKA